MRKLVILALVGLAGAGTAIAASLGSAQAQSPNASFTAVDSGTTTRLHFWYSAQTMTNAVTIVPGGIVYFSYPLAADGLAGTHNVEFTGPPPTTCTQTSAGAGQPAPGPAPPLPPMAEPPGWSGFCRFDTPGVYTFDSAIDGPAMSGTITVGTTSTTPTHTTTQPSTSTGSTTTTFHEPPIPAAASSLRAAAKQRGGVVRARIHVTAPGSRLIADLLLGRPAVRVGRTTLHGVSDGIKQFTVHLYARGSKALRLHHQLKLTLRVQVLLSGALGPTTLSRHVTLTG